MNQSNQSNKINSKTSGNLSEQIMNYYYKFGQNRDLEKYLRLKSSSEGSLSISTSDPDSCIKHNRLTDENNDDTNDEYIENHPNIKICSKQNKKDHTKAKKSFSFNCESNIAITFPGSSQTISMPNLSPKPSPKLNKSITEASQTDFEEFDENVSCTIEEIDSQTPAKTTKNDSKSPESNLKSTSKRLEWDSLADVGYDKTKIKENKSSSLSTLERSILKDFFADKGIEINFQNIHKNSIINEESPTRSSSHGAIPKILYKEKWRETLESVKKKYRSSPALTGSNLSGKNSSQFRDISKNHHSTPKTIGLEKCCQTSLVKKESQEIQCNFSNDGTVRSAFDIGSMTSQSSFEYIPQVLESEASCSNKENISPKTPPNETVEQKLHKSVAKLFELQKQSVNCKKITKEVQLGIKLLCSLIESKNMNDEQKKYLAKKIVSKITKTTQNLSSTNSTTTTNANSSNCASISSSVSTQSLIDSKSSSRYKHGKLTISGVQSIIDSDKSVKSSCCSSLRHISCNSNSIEKSLNKKINTTGNKIKKTDFTTNLKTENKSSQVNMQSLEKTMQKLVVNEHLEIPTKDDETSGAETTTTKSEPTEELETMREWLEPLTRSELKYANLKKNDGVKDAVVDIGGGGDFIPTTKLSQKMLKTIEHEKITHLNWIEKEIKRLENLKNLLLTEQNINSVPPMNYDVYQLSVNNTTDKKYDKVASTSNSNSQSSTETSIGNRETVTQSRLSKNFVKVHVHSEVNNIKEIHTQADYTSTKKNKKQNENIIYDEAEKGSSEHDESVLENILVIKEKKFPKFKYRDKCKLATSTRSKLETPRATERTESVRSFAQQKKRNFIESYKKAHSRDYDRQSESDHYSEPINPDNPKMIFTKNNAYPSVSSTDFFVSSESISMPNSVGDSSTTTTTHQYDSHCGIGIQTTDSILKTSPIFGVSSTKKCNCKRECNCKFKIPGKPTLRVYSSGKNQQIQVNPQAISYVIKFNKYKDSNDLKTEKSEEYMTTISEESLTLEQHFQKKNPNFFTKATDRQHVLRKMQRIRQEREEKIRDIVENTSIRSIPRKLDQLPPPATKKTRVFSTKEMKAITKRKQTNFPEVKEKIEKELNDRRKKGNKILQDVFNKKLQRRVHKGKSSLEHSQTVI